MKCLSSNSFSRTFGVSVENAMNEILNLLCSPSESDLIAVCRCILNMTCEIAEQLPAEIAGFKNHTVGLAKRLCLHIFP